MTQVATNEQEGQGNMSTRNNTTWTVVGGLAALVLVGLLIWGFVASGKDANQESLNDRYDQVQVEVTANAEALAESLSALSVLDPDGEVFVSGVAALESALEGDVPALDSDTIGQAYLARLDSEGTIQNIEAEPGESVSIEGRPLSEIAEDLGLLADAEAQPGATALDFPDRPSVVTQEDIDALGQVAANLNDHRQAVDAEVAALLWGRG